jgi:hypothetical protein
MGCNHALDALGCQILGLKLGLKQAAEKPLNAVILSQAKNPRSWSFNELRRSFVVRQ